MLKLDSTVKETMPARSWPLRGGRFAYALRLDLCVRSIFLELIHGLWDCLDRSPTNWREESSSAGRGEQVRKVPEWRLGREFNTKAARLHFLWLMGANHHDVHFRPITTDRNVSDLGQPRMCVRSSNSISDASSFFFAFNPSLRDLEHAITAR